jgi:hypothetical protein
MTKNQFTEAQLKRIAEIQEERSTTRKNATKVLRREERAIGKKPKSAKPKKQRANKSVATGRKPALAKYVKETLRIFGTFKGKEFQAHVNADGTITFDGETYTSPSVAAATAIKRKTCNGWKFWRYTKDVGSETTTEFIDDLRKTA